MAQVLQEEALGHLQSVVKKDTELREGSPNGMNESFNGGSTGGDTPIDFSIKRPRLSSPDSDGSRSNSNLSTSPLPRDYYQNGAQNGSLSSEHSGNEESNGLWSNNVKTESEIQPGVDGAIPSLIPGYIPPEMQGQGVPIMCSDPRLAAPAVVQQQRQQQVQQQGNNKLTRPFKAYPKDPLSLPLGYYGIPGMLPYPLDSNMSATIQAMAMSSEELFEQYRKQVMRAQNDFRSQRTRRSNSSNSSTAGSDSALNNPPVQGPVSQTIEPRIDQPLVNMVNNVSNAPNTIMPPTPNIMSTPNIISTPNTSFPTSLSLPSSLPSSPVPATSTSSCGRKKGIVRPDNEKDEAYWERRRKNNEAAKRSRDSRRAKEDEIAIRAAFLEQENLKLRVEVAALKNETAKLRYFLK